MGQEMIEIIQNMFYIPKEKIIEYIWIIEYIIEYITCW